MNPVTVEDVALPGEQARMRQLMRRRALYWLLLIVPAVLLWFVDRVCAGFDLLRQGAQLLWRWMYQPCDRVEMQQQVLIREWSRRARDERYKRERGEA